jgi:hypothetical protein
MAEKNVAHTFESVQGLALGFTSAAHQSGVELPLATMQDFEAVAHSTRAVSKAAILAYAPLLTTATELRNWNVYSVNHSYWIEQGREQSLIMAKKANTDNEHNDESDADEGEHDEHDDHHDHVRRTSETDENHHATTETIADHVFELDIGGGRHIASQVVKERAVSPLWQMTPVPERTDMINFNLASNILFDELLSFTVASRNLVLSKLVQADALFGHSNADDYESNSPASVLLQPVFDELGPEGRVVGTVAAVIRWTDFFNGVRASAAIKCLVGV